MTFWIRLEAVVQGAWDKLGQNSKAYNFFVKRLFKLIFGENKVQFIIKDMQNLIFDYS